MKSIDLNPVRQEPGDHQLHNFLSNHPFPHCHGLAHPPALLCRILVENSRTADARLDHRNADSDARPTHDDSPIFGFDAKCNFLREIWVMT